MSRFWVAFGKWRTLSRWTRGCSQGRGGLCPVPLVSPAVPPGLAHKYPFPVPCLAPVRGHTQRDPQAQQMLPCVRRSLLRSESALQAAQEAFADLAALKMLGPGLADAGWLAGLGRHALDLTAQLLVVGRGGGEDSRRLQTASHRVFCAARETKAERGQGSCPQSRIRVGAPGPAIPRLDTGPMTTEEGCFARMGLSPGLWPTAGMWSRPSSQGWG